MYTLADYVSDALDRKGYWAFDRVIGPDGKIQVKFIPKQASSIDWNGPMVYGVVKVIERFGTVVCDADRRVIKAIEDSIREMHEPRSTVRSHPGKGNQRDREDLGCSNHGRASDAEHHGHNRGDTDVSETD
jgi:hypothetical protein